MICNNLWLSQQKINKIKVYLKVNLRVKMKNYLTNQLQ